MIYCGKWVEHIAVRRGIWHMLRLVKLGIQCIITVKMADEVFCLRSESRFKLCWSREFSIFLLFLFLLFQKFIHFFSNFKVLFGILIQPCAVWFSEQRSSALCGQWVSTVPLIFFTPALRSNSSLAFCFLQLDDKSSYKNKYFTLMSAMKQLQNTFLRAQKNAERNVKGTFTTNNVLSYYVVGICNGSPVFALFTMCHIVLHSCESEYLSFERDPPQQWECCVMERSPELDCAM